MTGRRVDVAIIGDGPAGSALAAQCARRNVDVLLVGADDDWTATYGTWVDDLTQEAAVTELAQGSIDDWFVHTVRQIGVHTDHAQLLTRPYGVIANDRLRADLRRHGEHLAGVVDHVETGRVWHHVVLSDGRIIHARMVVDAAGWPARFATGQPRAGGEPAWQTAFGVVVAEPPAGELGSPVLMDLRPAPAAERGFDQALDDVGERRDSTIGPAGVATFAYAVPVADGWLVEETVLAARPLIEPVSLVARLAARLGQHPDDLLAGAVRTEYVRIPMGGSLPTRNQPVVAFGAAAGYVHPATGFSVAASIRAADRVAEAIATAVDEHPDVGDVIDTGAVWQAVWPQAMRRTRLFHEFGLQVLLRLEGAGVAEFFAEFFELPVDRWSAFLRIDTDPAQTASVMTELFRSAPWSLRRRLLASNPTALARLLHP